MQRHSDHLLLVCLILTITRLTLGYQHFQQEIPNGVRVPDPSVPGSIWQGVGHNNANGGGTRNIFGQDFAASEHVSCLHRVIIYIQRWCYLVTIIITHTHTITHIHYPTLPKILICVISCTQIYSSPTLHYFSLYILIWTTHYIRPPLYILYHLNLTIGIKCMGVVESSKQLKIDCYSI